MILKACCDTRKLETTKLQRLELFFSVSAIRVDFFAFLIFSAFFYFFAPKFHEKKTNSWQASVISKQTQTQYKTVLMKVKLRFHKCIYPQQL